MQKVILGTMLFILIATACKKNSQTTVRHPIQGLWVGTYSNNIDTFFFSLSIYDDYIQNVSYEQHAANYAINFGYGGWTTEGNKFIFSGHPDTGTFIYNTLWGSAIYDSIKRTLTNGILRDSLTGNSYIWSMNKVN